MSESEITKYSIKVKLQQLLTSQKENISIFTPQMDPDDLIYNPSYHNYFLHSVDKEIKHQGNLFNIIKKKIKDFKEKQEEKKRIKNSKHHYSHQMFVSQPHRRKFFNNKSVNQHSVAPYFPDRLQQIRSTITSARDTLKGKTSSISIHLPNRVKTACQSRQLSNVQSQSSTFNLYRGADPNESLHIYKNGRLMKQGKIERKIQFQVMGSKPQWNNFQCYRSKKLLIAKK